MRPLPLLVALLCAVGCAAPKDEPASEALSGSSVELTPACGVVSEGVVRSTVHSEEGVPVRIVETPASNQVIVELPDGGLQLVKLSGVAEVDPSRQNAVRSAFRGITSQETFFYPAGEACAVTVSGGGQGLVGQLLTISGESYSEVIISRNLAEVTSAEPCAIAEYVQCLAALRESNPVTAGELDAFLWKPISDSDGRLAVHTGPYGTTVIVNGETGRNAGPGNGYGSLARFSRSGCSYAGAQVQVLNTSSGLAYTVGGQTTFTIPNPCGRHCLVNGQIQACSK